MPESVGRVMLALVSMASLGACAVNPSTGRSQLIALPAAQLVHANIGFSIAAAAQSMVPSSACTRSAHGESGDDAACLGEKSVERFALQVRRTGSELSDQARILAPELFERMAAFDIRVESELGTGSASSAGGRIALDARLATLNPTDDVVAFLIAREMGHVIARHGEEDSGARLTFSALTAMLPGGAAIKLIASMLGSQALKASWAEGQRREADDLALALLSRTKRSPRTIALNLQSGLVRSNLPGGEWGAYFSQSVERVQAIAFVAPAQPRFSVAAVVGVPGVDVANEIR